MNTFKMFVVGMGLLLLGGCVVSLNPVYTDADLVTDPAFVGTYLQEDGKASWQLSPGEGKSYQLLLTDEHGKESRFVARVAEVKGVKFLDLTVDPTVPSGGDFQKMHMLPIHTIYRINEVRPNVVLGAIDFNWLNEQLAGPNPPIAYAKVGEGKVITAPTAELQKFLVDNRDRFSNTIRLNRKGE